MEPGVGMERMLYACSVGTVGWGAREERSSREGFSAVGFSCEDFPGGELSR